MPPHRHGRAENGHSAAAAVAHSRPVGEDPDPATAATPVADILARARGYPYARPSSSFVFHGGAAHTFEDGAWPAAGGLAGPACVQALGLACARAAAATVAALDAGLTPVLAIGSNAGPAQLARKFGGRAFAGTAIPAPRGLLHGFDVVFAPLVSSYGSVTATLAPSPGTAVEVYVSWLDPAALRRMHDTEAAYDLVALDLRRGSTDGPTEPGPALALGTSAAAAAAGAPPAAWHDAGRSGPVLCYVHQHGSLLLPPAALAAAGWHPERPHPTSPPAPAALAEVAALGRALPALTQVQAQAAVAELVGAVPAASGGDIDAFILENVMGDPAVRAARVRALAAHAAPFAHPAATRLATLGSVYGRSVD